MKAPHVLRVDAPPAAFEALFAALAASALRAGWLDLASPRPVPEPLAEAAGFGALRAVAVDATGSVAVKPRKGAPVLKDLLREFFLGCRLVLLRAEKGSGAEAPAGAEGLPRLEVGPGEGECWAVVTFDGLRRTYTTDRLIAALRQPRPWPLPQEEP